ncbi:AAA family ATPase [Parabacteroides sp. PF5-9]|uniref:AAA family ATPase n=1 Tax=Parabacteroides sp. PF5-9 TaxID=1742404 RepID=UPI0024766036|nr:AAA family ATPase [Parabacteroides sp. PF5-9]MDH6357133.1 hypothetical protein [Parabacteroides sp. PF5-9]
MENNNPINWREARLNINEEFSEPPVILMVEDSIVCTLGNFSASSGKDKSKKTFNVSAMTASLLSGKPVLNYYPFLPNDRQKILYVDTEQSPFHCIKVAKRILKLADKELTEVEDSFIFLSLRRYAPKVRIQIIEQAIEDNPEIFLVIIDGIRDLVLDINSPSEATEIMGKLLKWTDEKSIHIHTVIHLNKVDENTRGHLGTELNNKAETVMQVTKSTDDSNISVVSPKSVRDVEFNPFAFCINENALPELTESHSTSKQPSKGFDYNELSESEHREALEMAFESIPQVGYNQLIEVLQKAYQAVAGVDFGVNKTKGLKKFLINKRMIIQIGKKYEYNKDFHY